MFVLISIVFFNLTACGSVEKNFNEQNVKSINGETFKGNDHSVVDVADLANDNSHTQTNENNQFEKVTVERSVDGDTFVLTDGRKIRLVGVNTPESTTKIETYGKEASNYTQSKLEGKTVYLQKDVSDMDKYGRYLRIVWMKPPYDTMSENEIRTKMFNAMLVLNGYAEPSTYEPDITYSKFFQKFAIEARQKGIGLWAYGTNGTTKGDFDY